MDVRQVQLTFDAADPKGLAGFWCAALGYQDDAPPPGYASWDEAMDAMQLPPERRNDRWAAVDPTGSGPRIFFLKVPAGTQAKNRLHLDVRAAPGLRGEERMAALELESQRLVALGATRVARHDPAPPLDGGHLVLEDPEGNVFCLD